MFELLTKHHPTIRARLSNPSTRMDVSSENGVSELVNSAAPLTFLKYYSIEKSNRHEHAGIVLNYCQYGVLYLGSYYNTGPYINFPHFGNSNLGKPPCSVKWKLGLYIVRKRACQRNPRCKTPLRRSWIERFRD